MGTDSNFVHSHSTTAHPPAGAGGRLASLGMLVRSVAAEGGTKNPVALYSEPHLLWRRLGTWSLRAWMYPSFPMVGAWEAARSRGVRSGSGRGVGLGSTASLSLFRTPCTYSWVRSSIKTGQVHKGRNSYLT